MSENKAYVDESVIVIRPPKGWFYLNLKELWDYRELAYFFVWRDIKVRYKQTVIGALWAILQPFTAMVVFSIFFGTFIKIPSDGIPYPVFVYTGLILWNYFSFGLSHAANSMVENAGIIQKIYFPRLIIPIASSLTGLVDFTIATVVLVGIMVYYHFTISFLGFIYLPLLLFIIFLSSVGLGCFLASINVKYRDVRYIIPFLIQMFMFITPVIYPISIIEKSYRWLIAFNPMANVIETARVIFLGNGQVNVPLLGFSVFIGLLLFIVGVIYFRKTERFFADIV